MGHEANIVEATLEKHQLSSRTNLDNLKELLLKLITIFANQNKGPLNVSKNMVIVLHKILTTNEPNFLNWVGEFADENFSLLITNLRSLRYSQEIYSIAMADTHTQFSARCIQLADYDLLVAEKRLLIFSQQKSGEQTLADLSLKRQKAQDKLVAVRDFCYKNKISM